MARSSTCQWTIEIKPKSSRGKDGRDKGQRHDGGGFAGGHGQGPGGPRVCRPRRAVNVGGGTSFCYCLSGVMGILWHWISPSKVAGTSTRLCRCRFECAKRFPSSLRSVASLQSGMFSGKRRCPEYRGISSKTTSPEPISGPAGLEDSTAALAALRRLATQQKPVSDYAATVIREAGWPELYFAFDDEADAKNSNPSRAILDGRASAHSR
jgi:hypothetical protein